MKTRDFYFDLPESLIAQNPAEARGNDRLLLLDRISGKYEDRRISDLPSILSDEYVMVLNNSKVRKARVFAYSDNGGRVEFLFLSKNPDSTWRCMVSKAKKQKIGKTFTFYTLDGMEYRKATIVSECGDQLRNIEFSSPVDESFFTLCGHVPLPPYIKREDNFRDETRYQTVYAKKEGSVASPTAGLHFTSELLSSLRDDGIGIYEVTLHVGMGTFLPVRSENIEDHNMHTESYEIVPLVAESLNKAKADGKKILSVGTTSLRTLESASNEDGRLVTLKGDTSIFITPGYRFKFIDSLFTNFHTPESTLLMLVSALAGREKILNAYKHAIENEYRFFSYGDAMLIR